MIFMIIMVIIFPVVVFRVFIYAREPTRSEREHFIRSYVFSEDLLAKLKNHHPHLEEQYFYMVARALRKYFIVHARAGKQLIGMPSRVVDDLWHEFILDTRTYELFCKEAFGGYFHHVPASATTKGADIEAALCMTWRYACLEESINPKNPTRLPLLFEIDEKLRIANGNTYTMKEKFNSAGTSASCGGIACGGSACGGATCCGDGGGSAGGCGGGGCSGGGCGGGGD